jgi:hypothetical protein
MADERSEPVAEAEPVVAGPVAGPEPGGPARGVAHAETVAVRAELEDDDEERPNLVPVRVRAADDTDEFPAIPAEPTGFRPVREVAADDTDEFPAIPAEPTDFRPVREVAADDTDEFPAIPREADDTDEFPAIPADPPDQLEVDEREVDQREADELEADQLEADQLEADQLEANQLEADRPEAVPIAPEPIAVDPITAERAEPAGRALRVGRTSGLGQAPWILALSSSGVLLVAFGYAGGRYPNQLALTAYWLGQIVVFTPVVLRLLTRRLAGIAESFVLVIGLAVNQYLLKWCYSPDQFRFPDELQHWLATTIINQSGRLFRPNPALPPAVHFPGLAEMGAAVSQLTGLPVTAAGFIVAGVCHLGLVAGLYLAVLRASRSPATAGVTCVFYATSLHYLFFNSMYLYQTAALAFLMLTIWASRRFRVGNGWQFGLLTVAGILVTTICHHVTAGALVLTLLLIGIAEISTVRPRPWKSLIVPAVALAVVACWILVVARDVIAYLDAPLSQVWRSLSRFADRQPTASAAASPPLWQLAIQAIGLLLLLGLFLAVAQDALARRRRDPWLWAALAGSVVFFAGNAVRFLGSNGPEIAGRLSTFTFVPMSIIAAIGLVRAVRLMKPVGSGWRRWFVPSPEPAPGRRLSLRVLAGALMITVLMAGARVGGWPPAKQLLPGPYLADAFERSVDAYGIDAADWEREVLGPGQRTGGDLTAIALTSTYGRQDPVRGVAPLFYTEQWTDEDQTLTDRLALRYLVVDQRLGGQVPANQQYFDDDPDAGRITAPLSAGQLDKFDALPQWSRLYDNGPIRIYRAGVT